MRRWDKNINVNGTIAEKHLHALQKVLVSLSLLAAVA